MLALIGIEPVERNDFAVLGKDIVPWELKVSLLLALLLKTLNHKVKLIIFKIIRIPFRNFMEFKLSTKFHCWIIIINKILI